MSVHAQLLCISWGKKSLQEYRNQLWNPWGVLTSYFLLVFQNVMAGEVTHGMQGHKKSNVGSGKNTAFETPEYLHARKAVAKWLLAFTKLVFTHFLCVKWVYLIIQSCLAFWKVFVMNFSFPCFGVIFVLTVTTP